MRSLTKEKLTCNNLFYSHSFGIFRLTDPPGLRTILECTAKQAFHPHPDIPIYTVCFPLFARVRQLKLLLQDADRGHVQMKDIPLEIVDLR